jgi:hypothetical protein
LTLSALHDDWEKWPHVDFDAKDKDHDSALYALKSLN